MKRRWVIGLSVAGLLVAGVLVAATMHGEDIRAQCESLRHRVAGLSTEKCLEMVRQQGPDVVFGLLKQL